MFDWFGGIVGGRRPAITAATWRTVRAIEALAPEMEALNDLALKRLGQSLSYRARSGEDADSLIIDSFAATREAGRRRLGMRHYDVQLLAGVALALFLGFTAFLMAAIRERYLRAAAERS